MSSEALDLVVKMTDSDQYKRPLAAECLKHPWFCVAKSNKKILRETLNNFINSKEKLCLLENTKNGDDENNEKIKNLFEYYKRLNSKSTFENLRSDSPFENSKDSCTIFPLLRSKSFGIEILQGKNFGLKLKLIEDSSVRVKSSLNKTIYNPFLCDESILKDDTNIEDDFDDIPDERIPRLKSKDILINRSFTPEKNEVRIIPCIEIGKSKTMLEKHFIYNMKSKTVSKINNNFKNISPLTKILTLN